LRRTIIIGTALAVLAVAGAAFAAAGFNTYTAKWGFSPSKAGSAKKPVAVGITESLSANGTGGNRAAPLVRLTTTFYGLRTNGKYFPTCSLKTVGSPPTYDKACPKGSLVAQGPVTGLLGPGNDGSASHHTPCDPYLHVYNSGQGKLTYFFNTIPPTHTCAGLPTGASAPYPATLKIKGKNLVLDLPLPPDVSTVAGNLKGVYASLITFDLKFAKLTKKVHGKTVGFIESIGCNAGKRPWSQKFTAVNFSNLGGGSESATINGSTKC
jgi:hypothetical protein